MAGRQTAPVGGRDKHTPGLLGTGESERKMASAMNSLPQKVRVCVVGAGVAGLGAAQRLAEAGMQDFVILEAEERVGGRVCTVKHGDGQIELGAHWIHGEENNVIYQWASENNLTSDEPSQIQTGRGNTVYLRANREVVPEDVLGEFSKTFAKLQEGSEKDYMNYSGSVGQYFVEKFKTLNKWGALGDELLEWEGRFQDCINGSENWFEVSAKGLLQYKECPGNPVVNWKQGGYRNLVDHLMEKIPPSCLVLGSPIKHIERGSDVLSGRPGCKVTLTSGALIQADHVIFTPCIGVLKARAGEMFSPPLPDQKIKAIEGLGIYVVNKIYVQFPHRWWSEDCDGFSFLHDEPEKPIPITEENWEQGLVGFYSAYQHPTTMCAWITSRGAKMMELTPVEEVAQRCVAHLRKMLPSKYQVPDAVVCRRSMWGTNPWTNGSYSFRSLKSEEMGVTAADLAEPLYDLEKNTPLLCFAGEATHDCYYSTVHGALESGWREADRLIKYFSSVSRVSSHLAAELREKYTVVIVGAGAAGIGAARELKAQGINSVLILEASDRIGGRINTVQASPHGIVELGAQWIHGEEENVLFQFAKSRNLLHQHFSLDGNGIFFMEGGREIDDKIVEEVLGIMDEADQECCDVVHKKDSTTSSLSVGQVFRKVFYEYLEKCVNDSPETKRIKEALFYWSLRWHRIDNACDSLNQLSANCWGSYKFCEGERNMNPKNGFLSILNALLAETTAVVKLNSEVECIEYSTEVIGTKSSFLRSDGVTFPVIIRCKDGREYEAQHVLATPALGYLKKNLSLFSPPLPEILQQTLMCRGFGTLGKIFLEYEDKWWGESCEGIQLVWTKDIPDFEYTTSPHESQRQHTCDWWVKAISGFDPVFYHKAMLCGWIGGCEAEHMETLSEEEVGRACTRLLKSFLGQKNIPLPKKVYRSQWANNRLFQGSYTYHNLACSCWSGSAYENQLNTPVFGSDTNGNKVPILALAGEANSTAFYSTVHGALQNGMEQALHFANAQSSLAGSRRPRSKL